MSVKDIVHDVSALVSRYFTTRTHFTDCTVINFYSDALHENFVSAWRLDKAFYNKHIDELFKK